MAFMTYLPTLTHFGAGALNNLHAQRIPGKKALIVISNGKSTITNGSLDTTIKELKMAGVESVVFNKVQANPTKVIVEEGAQLAKETGCDVIVALGGGSCIDASKAIALLTTNEGDLWDYVATGSGAKKQAPNRPLPIIAIPTTAGTGSEADPAGVITNEKNEKLGVGDFRLFPAIAIIDPELMKSVPAKFTAYQGFDAFFHSAEGYIGNRANLMSDMVGETAMENVGRYLERAVKDGSDMVAREHMAFASYLSGIEMVVGSTSSQHSLEHALSAYHEDIPHGAGLIMLSKAYFSYWINKHVCDERFVKMAQLLGRINATQPEEFIIALEDLKKACSVADLKMSDYGVTQDEFEKMAENAIYTMPGQFAVGHTQMPKEDCVAIYKESYK